MELTLDKTLIRETLSDMHEMFAAYRGPTGTLYRLLLDHGRDYRSVRWTTWRGTGYRRGPVRACFKNAYLLADRHPGLTYVEGFARRAIAMPIHHAWAATPDGRVVDPTWRPFGSDDDVESWEYVGVPFDFYWLDELTDAQGVYGAFADGVPSDVVAGIAR